MIILVSVVLLTQMVNTQESPVKKLTYTEYDVILNQDKIASGKIMNNRFYGELKIPESTTINNREASYTKFVVVLPFVDKTVLESWDAHQVKYDFQEDQRDWVDYLFNFLPWLILIFAWIFIMRRMQGNGTKGIFSFGKSKGKIIDNEKPEITFKDVAGVDEGKMELQEIVQFLKNPKKFQRLGGKIPKGALLVGPPGTGKTLLARAIAGEAGVPFYSLSGADFVEMFVGVGASRVRDMFDQGKKNAPCIIFIDEIDAVGRQRGAGLGGGHDEREQTLNALLVEMDGFETNDNVILLAATNRPDVLDSALLRPGRFDRRILVDLPDVKGREAILKVHLKNIKADHNIRLDIIAKGTPGMSGADLANVLNESALLAARKNKNRVTMEDIEEAKDKVIMGVERRSLVISEKEKKTTAIHEAGHALVAKFIEDSDPIHKVTIVPRGRALGLTSQLPVDDRHNYSKTYLEGMLAILMGGRVAELLILDQKTTGAGNDIERATGLARKMICEWGMSEKLGPLTFGKKSEEIFVGREFGMHRDFSEDMAKKIDTEVKNLIEKGEKVATKIIKEHLEFIHKISEKLIEDEIITGRDIDIILGRPVEDERPRKSFKPRQSQGRSRNYNQRKPRNVSEKSSEVKTENTAPKLVPPPIKKLVPPPIPKVNKPPVSEKESPKD